MKKLVIIQTTTPDYRAGFFRSIAQRLGSRFELYRGARYFDLSVTTDPTIPATEITNHYFLGRKALFQTGIWHLLFTNAVLVLELNPRILSHWIFLLSRKLTRKTTVLWGHAWPRSGKDSKSDLLRHWMRLLASQIIVYTEQQRRELQDKMPSKSISAAPNALLSSHEMMVPQNNAPPSNLLYVGRLVAAKKPLFLVEAFHKSMTVVPEDSKLILIGQGEETQRIQAYLDEYRLHDRVIMTGHVNDYEMLRSWYGSSLFSVSPGYAGLSITQSFGFGVPMLISRDEQHAPEIEAAVPGFNAVFYETDDFVDFRESVQKIFKEQDHWMEKRQRISSECKALYSVEAMAAVFINLVEDDA